MSTYDVPGARAENRDELAPGCWAEHEDGSLLYVNALGEGSVYFQLFADAAEWPGVLKEDEFKERFSWKEGKRNKHYKWLWHDKTPFDWARVAKTPGTEVVVGDRMTAAERVGLDLGLRAKKIADNAGPRIKKEMGDFLSALSGRLPP